MTQVVDQDEAETLRLFAEHAADVLVRVGADGRVLYVSPSVKRYGYDPANLVGATGDQLIHPDDRAGFAANVAALLQGDSDPDRDRRHRMRTHAGEWRWVEGNPHLVRDEDGRPTGFINVFRDIHTRKLLADSAKERAELFEAAFENSATGKIVLGMDGRILRANPWLLATLGYRTEDVIGKTDNDFAHPDEIGRFGDQYWSLIRGEIQNYSLERRYRRSDGVYIWCTLIVSMAADAEGRPKFILGELQDLSHWIAAQEELTRQREEAEAADQAKTQFMANMSHEIRTPLTAIVGFAGLLNRRRDLDPDALGHVEKIVLGGETLLSVVNDILDFSKLNAGQLELDRQAFGVAAFMDETLSLVRDQAARKGVAVTLDLEPRLSPGVYGDEGRLRQILLNLLMNAIKFTDTGSVSVRVRRQGAGDRLRFEVTDTGVGISPSDIGRLFQRFSQVDESNTRRHGGTGLGLAICKGLVDAMGGEIGVTSEPEVGSTFWFEIPAPSTEAPISGLTPPPAESAPVGATRILVVDDVMVNRELVRALLRDFDIEIVEATSGAEAVDASLAGRFDVILMDMQMPGMDGMEATRAIRANSDANRDTPILAFSANVLPEQVDAARQAGMDDHVGKPVDPAVLLPKLADWAGRRSAYAA